LLSVSQLSCDRGEARFHKQQQRALERLQHLEATIDAMLRFLRGTEQEEGAVAVVEILGGLRQEFDLLFRQKNVILQMPQVSPDWFLTGSRAAWVSVLANLLHNALFYSPPASTVLLSLQLTGEGDLVLAIADAGPGIAEADREKVFTPFYTSRSDGTGLGLAITRNFVVAMGGAVGIEAAASGGARFVLRLPLWQSPQPLPSGAMMQEKT
ncbi:MAG: sensor histidine kinase, partial [Acidithiobacillus sp.]